MSFRTHSDRLQFIAAIIQLAFCIGSFIFGAEGAREVYRGIHLHFHFEGAERVELDPRLVAEAGEVTRDHRLPIILDGDLRFISGPPRGASAPAATPIHQEPIRLAGGDATLFVLTDRYSWLRGSSQEDIEVPVVVHDGREIPTSHVLRSFQWSELTRRLEEATDVVAVGMASCEGNSEDEYRRAGVRAVQILRWLRQAQGHGRFPRLRARTLNLGRYGSDCPGVNPESTQFQRRLVVLAVKRDSGHRELDNHDLIEALRISNLLGVDPYDYEAATLSAPEPF